MELLSNLHPKIVHFSISLLVIYFIFELAGFMLKKEYLTKSSYILLIFGILSAILSVFTGNQAYQSVINNVTQNELINLIERHQDYATMTVWYFTFLFFVRTYLLIKKKFFRKYQLILVLLSFIGAIFILLTAHFGGELVFKYGLGTKLFGK
ncbi:MAG: DUF2231 domain-containing protein [Melioribacteraceae bacterium]